MALQDSNGQQKSYLTYRKALVDYVSSIIGSRADAEDVVQDAFIRFLPKNGPTTVSTKAYLFRIARNLAFDLTRRRQMEARHENSELPHWATPQRLETPEEAAIIGDDLIRISKYLDSCSKETRIAIEMYRFGGHTMEQIANDLDLSIASVHRILRKSMLEISEIIDQSA
ncbi:RNA polymerase sigma factor [Roseibium algae]|uniref:Sigma-70 family RNA polymerase sigma factor n=1 Tax=Roseibium algae TaxID=3123038 RepID=A0ABU8TEJ4_9HYPH